MFWSHSALRLEHAWLGQLGHLLDRGQVSKPRGLKTYELLGTSLCIKNSAYNLLDVPLRKLNYRYAVAEWLWIAFGHSDVLTIAQYNSVLPRFSDDGITFTGAYGPHVGAQWPRVVDLLQQDPSSRQAVIEIPRPWNRMQTKDMPCTLSLQFLVRERLLHTIVTMRSSDIWLGVPYDVFTFTQLANSLAGELGVARGPFLLQLGSSHLYESNVDQADMVLTAGPPFGAIESPALPGRPPQWLDEVLRNPHQRYAEDFVAHAEPWRTYARVLTAASSVSARLILKGETKAKDDNTVIV